jgi:hypothetical protein
MWHFLEENAAWLNLSVKSRIETAVATIRTEPHSSLSKLKRETGLEAPAIDLLDTIRPKECPNNGRELGKPAQAAHDSLKRMKFPLLGMCPDTEHSAVGTIDRNQYCPA